MHAHLIPVLAALALSGQAAAAPAQQLDKKWCILGWGNSCGQTQAPAPTVQYCILGFGNGCTSTTAAAPAKTSAATSTVVAAAAAKTSSAATPTKSASWAQCTSFDWSQWQQGWSWGGWSVEYVKDWYIDQYGLNPPPGMNWGQVTSLVNKFGQKTVAAGPKATSKYTKGCKNPWTAANPQPTPSAAITSKAAPPPAVTPPSAGKPVDPAPSAVASSPAATSAASTVKAVAPSSAAATSAAAAPSSAAGSGSSGTGSGSSSGTGSGSSSGTGSGSSSGSGSGSSSGSGSGSSSGSSGSGSSSGTGSSGSGSPVVTPVVSAVASVVSDAPAAVSSAAAPAVSSAVAAVSYNGYAALGCYQEVSGRLLSKVQTSSASQTLESCTALCGSYGFQLSGVEYGNECYCGDYSALDNALVSGECWKPCAGDASQKCGGPNALNIFYNPAAQKPTVVLPAGWKSYGTVDEGDNGRALSTLLYASDDNTNYKCATSCAAAGFTVAGTEYSAECWCGNGFANGGGDRLDDSAAFMRCSGDLAEACGGPNVLTITSSLSVIPKI